MSSALVLTTETVTGLETSLWDAVREHNIGTFERLIADDALYIDESGVATKGELLSMLPDVELRDFLLTDIRVTRLSDCASLVVYRCVERVAVGDDGQPKSVTKLASSLWQTQSVGPVVTFHQETLCSDSGGDGSPRTP